MRALYSKHAVPVKAVVMVPFDVLIKVKLPITSIVVTQTGLRLGHID